MQKKIQNISPIKQRILQFVKENGLSKREFYTKSGISRGTLESNTGITEETITKFFATFPQADVVNILTGQEAKKKTYPGNDVDVPVMNQSYSQNDLICWEQRIPIFVLEARTGLASLFNEMEKQTPANYLYIPNLPKCDGAIRITGDSMYPLLKSGDIILYKVVHDIKNSIFWGEMYLLSVDVDGEEYVTVRYIHKVSDDPEYVRLVSHNKNNSDKEVLLSSIQALALVKASVRINSMH